MLETAVRLREGAISRVQKERILLSIAADQRDTYRVALDSRVLSSLGLSDGQIGDLLNGSRHAGLSAPDFAKLHEIDRIRVRRALDHHVRPDEYQ
jgi:hypothetical protein